MEHSISLDALRSALKGLTKTSDDHYADLSSQLDRDVLDDLSSVVSLPSTSYRIVKIQDIPISHGGIQTVEEIAQNIARKSVEQGYPAPDLDNDVHPLLAKEKWLDMSDEEYDVMFPVLQLASKFLYTPTCWEFYEHLATAQSTLRTKHKESGREVCEVFLARPAIEPTLEAKHAAVRRVIDSMIRGVTFRIDRAPPGPGEHRYMGMFKTPYVHLSHRVFSLLKHDRGNNDLGALTRRLRYTFTLLHEIAHAFTVGAHWQAMVPNKGNEPRYTYMEPWRESGYSWERVTLGYPTHDAMKPQESRDDFDSPEYERAATLLELSYESIMGACARYSPEFNTIRRSPIRRYFPSSLITEMFQKSTWERIAREGLGFVQREASRLRFEIKVNKPVRNWTTIYYPDREGEELKALCFRTGGDALASHGVLFKLIRTAAPADPTNQIRYVY